MTDKHLDTPIGSPGKIRTYSGRLVDPFNLAAEDVMISDVAHALSNLCRFTGHVRRFYSVGEHCLLVASLLTTPRLMLAGLVHDASEAYFGDMAGPIKRRLEMGEYNTAEHHASRMIMRKYCGALNELDLLVVKEADGKAYAIERKVLVRPGLNEDYESNTPDLGTMTNTTVEISYLKLFHHLCNQL